MLAGTPSRRDLDAACAAFGVAASEVDDGAQDAGEVLELWPEHADVVRVFQRMAGQWRLGPGGPVALDYTALPVVLGLMRMGRRAGREVFEPLRVMEAEALAWFDEQQG